MAKKIRLYNIEIERLEEADNKNIRCYYSYEGGESYFDISRESDDLGRFLPGKEYVGEFLVYGEEEKGEPSMQNSELERILDEWGNIFYSKKDK